MPSVSKGSIYRRAGTDNWSIKYYVDGHLERETAGTSDQAEAIAFLKQRIDEVKSRRFVERSARIDFDEMQRLLLDNYAFKRNRTSPLPHLKRLGEFFGGSLGEAIDEDRIRGYCDKGLKVDRVEAATLRRELAVLKRMLRLASPRLPRVPIVDMPRVDNARQGFFEEEDLQAVLPRLPDHARNLVEFLYLTGWRSGEAFRLQWGDLDWARQTVLLRDSKNREPRIFPFKFHPRLAGVLIDQRRKVSQWERDNGRMCPWVFHWRGRGMKKLRRSWTRACEEAGLKGRLLHDFRRTAVRNLIRAGVQQAIAMKITGHKTGSIFRRYLIVDEELLAEAAGAVAELLGMPKSPGASRPE